MQQLVQHCIYIPSHLSAHRAGPPSMNSSPSSVECGPSSQATPPCKHANAAILHLFLAPNMHADVSQTKVHHTTHDDECRASANYSTHSLSMCTVANEVLMHLLHTSSHASFDGPAMMNRSEGEARHVGTPLISRLSCCTKSPRYVSSQIVWATMHVIQPVRA